MADRIFDSGWVDRYVLNELSEDESVIFEAAMFESAALRRDVEVALSLQAVLGLDDAASESVQTSSPGASRRVQPWQPWAVAASVLVGVLGGAMWFKSASEISELHDQVAELSRSYDEVVVKRLDLTRSGGGTRGTPVLKPPGNALLVLDIELSPRTKDLDHAQIKLIDDAGQLISSWSGATTDRDRLSLGVRSSRLAEGPLLVEILDAEGTKLEEMRLEILADRQVH